MEWYDPKQAYTKGGHLSFMIDNAETINNHNMNYVLGMVGQLRGGGTGQESAHPFLPKRPPFSESGKC